MQILVVDDDRIFCQLLAELLASRGHEVDCGQAAHWRHSSWRSETIMSFSSSNVRMPRIPGTKLAEGLKEQFPAAKIILISAFADRPLDEQAVKLGIPLLGKPFTNEAVLELIAKSAHG